LTAKAITTVVRVSDFSTVFGIGSREGERELSEVGSGSWSVIGIYLIPFRFWRRRGTNA